MSAAKVAGMRKAPEIDLVPVRKETLSSSPWKAPREKDPFPGESRRLLLSNISKTFFSNSSLLLLNQIALMELKALI